MKLKYKIMVLAFLILTFGFALWQLDLIRDQFARAGIYYGNLNDPNAFDKVMWEWKFGFPPMCWFGIFLPLQVSFDLMYFLLAIVMFGMVMWIIDNLIPSNLNVNGKRLMWHSMFWIGFMFVLWDLYESILSSIDTPFRMHHGWYGLSLIAISWIGINIKDYYYKLKEVTTKWLK